MSKRSIMFLIEPGILGQRCLGRALMMARYLHASLDIVLWADQSGYVPTPARARLDAEREHQYLESLCKAIVAPDVEISSETASGSLSEIAHRAEHLECEMMVMQHGSSTDSLRRDLALLRECPVPILLTHGKAWHPQPRFAAAVAIAASASEPADSVMRAASGLRLACAAQLDLICIGSGRSQGAQIANEPGDLPQVAELGRKYDIQADHRHVLEGAAGRALPRLLIERGYDLVVVAAPGPEGLDVIGRDAWVVEVVSEDGDLLIVQSRNRAFQPEFSKRERFNWSTRPVWNWLGAD